MIISILDMVSFGSMLTKLPPDIASLQKHPPDIACTCAPMYVFSTSFTVTLVTGNVTLVDSVPELMTLLPDANVYGTVGVVVMLVVDIADISCCNVLTLLTEM